MLLEKKYGHIPHLIPIRKKFYTDAGTDVHIYQRSNSKLKFCCVTAGVLLLLTTGFALVNFPYPLHASCVVKWEIGEPCKTVQTAILQQMVTQDVCIKNEIGCHYVLQEARGNTLHGTHLSRRSHFTEDIIVNFHNDTSSSCTVFSVSRTRSWYIIFDYGKNYCNLHNLAVRAGLTNSKFFNEVTNNNVCTQYLKRNCSAFYFV